MKLKTVIKDVILESKDSYNTPAAISKQEELTKKKAKTKAEDSITDLDLNTMNRNNTIKNYSYGPLNPDDEKGSKKFWEDKAELWNTTIAAAKQSKCANCGAFDQKKSTLRKIEKAIGEDGKTIVKNANIGFCEFFWFKCAGARSCDAWVSGGPII